MGKSFQPATVNQGGNASKKRDLRSGEGSVAVSKAIPQKFRRYKSGRHLDTIVLHNCTAVGLMDAGVLPKPGVWEYQRMKRQSKNTKTIVEPRKIRRVKQVEIVNLVDGSSRGETTENTVSVFARGATSDFFDLSEILSDDEA